MNVNIFSFMGEVILLAENVNDGQMNVRYVNGTMRSDVGNSQIIKFERKKGVQMEKWKKWKK